MIQDSTTQVCYIPKTFVHILSLVYSTGKFEGKLISTQVIYNSSIRNLIQVEGFCLQLIHCAVV